MKKWSLTLKVFLIALAVCILYVLIASIVRIYTGQIAIDTAVIRFIIGSIGGIILAGVAAVITALVLDIQKKRKLSLTLRVFYIIFAVCVLFVLIADIVRVSVGQLASEMVVISFIIGSTGGVLVAGIAAGITKFVLAIKNLGK